MARSNILNSDIQLGLTLDRYAELMRIPEAAFNGLNRPEDRPTYECTTIWKQYNRDTLAQYIAMAEEMREQEIGTYIAEKYTTGDYRFGFPLILPKGNVVEIGEKATTTIVAGKVVSYGVLADPVTITTVTTVTDTDEIKVFYPGEDVEIHPSSISISGGTATIKIPRSRLADPTKTLNEDDSPNYSYDANFLVTVDIKRVYYDLTEGAKFIWRDCSTLNELTQRARPIIDSEKEAIIRCYPAKYTSGAWAVTAFTYSYAPDKIRLKYVSGIRASMNTELLTIRLAHSLMPYKPIDCEAVSQYWQRDTEVTKSNSPYGNTAGAIDVWVADSRKKEGAGGMLA